MLKRSLVFSSAVSLSLKNCQLVVSYKDMPDEKRTVPIEDVGCVLIDNPMTSITIPLINALADANVTVVVCNEKSMPNVMMQGMVILNQQVKGTLINVLYCDTQFERVMRPLSVGLTMTTASLVKCYAKESSTIAFPTMQ